MAPLGVAGVVVAVVTVSDVVPAVLVTVSVAGTVVVVDTVDDVSLLLVLTLSVCLQLAPARSRSDAQRVMMVFMGTSSVPAEHDACRSRPSNATYRSGVESVVLFARERPGPAAR